MPDISRRTGVPASAGRLWALKLPCRVQRATDKRIGVASAGAEEAPDAMAERMTSFAQFWPYYLSEHSRAGTRVLHLVGTTLAILLALSAVTTGRWLLLPGALVCGYAFAWLGHFLVEHNRPATFRYPLWSFAADFKMWWAALTGRLSKELQRVGRPS